MNCFDNLIGLKNSCLSAPKSGLFINDLGINNVLLDQYAGGNYLSGVELFTNKLNFTASIVAAEVLTKLSGKIKGSSLKDNIRIGFNQQPYTNTTPALGAGNWVGIRIKQDINSYVEFYITTINIQLEAAATGKVVKIFNVRTQQEIASYTVDSNTISDINKSITSLGRDVDVIIAYESTTDSIRTIVRDGYCGECGGGAGFATCGSYSEVVGVKALLNVDGSLASFSNVPYTYGLQVNYNISCDYLSWLCSISNQIALPVLYRLAAEINEYAIHIAPNERVNNATDGVDRLKSAYTYYIEQYNISMETVLKGMQLPKGDECFNCRENLRYSVSMP